MGEDTWQEQALRRLSALMSRASAAQRVPDLLHVIAEGAADVVGFQVAAISLARSDGALEVVAVAGDEDARAHLLGRRTPVAALEAEFELAERWGELLFIPHERAIASSVGGWVASDWRPGHDDGVADAPDWHPEDALLAPFYDPAGNLTGLLSVDLPLNGRQPISLQRTVLEVFAGQAAIVINNARQRARMEESVRLSAAVRAITRATSEVLDLGRIINASVQPIVTGLLCDGLWVRAFPGDGGAPERGRAATYPPSLRSIGSQSLLPITQRVARNCWTRQEAALVSDQRVIPEGVLTTDEATSIRQFIGRVGSHTLLLAPIGAGPECLGQLALTRRAAAPPWSDEEVDAVLEIGRDMGRAILNARLFARERELVVELQRAARSKTTLFSTVSHELKNPLASIIGHLELLMPEDEEPGWSLQVVERNARRLQTLVDDLLTFSRVTDPDRPLIRGQVDVRALVADAVDMLTPQATRQGVNLNVQEHGSPIAFGDTAELSAVVTNLLSNAVKYSPHGGDVNVVLTGAPGQVVMECEDHGLGMSAADQQHLFTEFFRSGSQEVRDIPGTGLGLSIVKRIINRHGGTIEFTSVAGAGTTARVTLPVSDPLCQQAATASVTNLL